MPETVIRMAIKSDFRYIVLNNLEMAQETEQLVLDKAVVEQGVKNVLNDPAKGVYLIAEVDRRIAGQLMLTREWSDWRNATFWWIQSVYIRPEYRETGLFISLYRQIKELAHKDGNICGLRLYVDKDNSAAQQAYHNSGLDKSNYTIYEQELTD